MKIRKATKRDIPKIGKLIQEEFAKSPYNEKWTNKAVKRTLDNYFKIGYAYVALINKNIVGAIVIRDEPYAYGLYITIEELIVSSKSQRKGVGKALIKKIESEARKKKVHTIYLSVHRKSHAFKFYEKLGYKESKPMAIMGKKLK